MVGSQLESQLDSQVTVISGWSVNDCHLTDLSDLSDSVRVRLESPVTGLWIVPYTNE